MAGRASASTSIVQLENDGGGRRLWLPLLDGTERLGVGGIESGRPEPLSEAMVALCERFSHLIATLVTNKDLYSDYFSSSAAGSR